MPPTIGNPPLHFTTSSSSNSTGTHQRPKPKSFYEIFALVRLELILLLLCLGQAFQVFIMIPMKAQAMKKIFMGMKVQLDRSTILVISYSDLLIAYPFLLLIVAGLLLAGVLAGIRRLGESANQAFQRGTETLARFQVSATVTPTMALIILLLFGAYADRALTIPLLRLISAGN